MTQSSRSDRHSATTGVSIVVCNDLVAQARESGLGPGLRNNEPDEASAPVRLVFLVSTIAAALQG
jgi:hypothetical protein